MVRRRSAKSRKPRRPPAGHSTAKVTSPRGAGEQRLGVQCLVVDEVVVEAESLFPIYVAGAQRRDPT
jgi:hypothetical protein